LKEDVACADRALNQYDQVLKYLNEVILFYKEQQDLGTYL
jgi:hypothetical protein